jgi:hypothetical protein
LGTVEEYLMSKLGKREFGRLLDAMNSITVKPRKRRGRRKKRG